MIADAVALHVVRREHQADVLDAAGGKHVRSADSAVPAAVELPHVERFDALPALVELDRSHVRVQAHGDALMARGGSFEPGVRIAGRRARNACVATRANGE